MRRDELADLLAFAAVAEEQSFTRAAARLSTSQSALSHTIKRLEARLGLRLLTRTTRSVAATEAGERLMETLRPAFDDIDARLSALTALREKPAGTVRITTGEHAATSILLPALTKLLPRYPEIAVELNINYGLTDIVKERFDAGVRLGEQIAKDMIAVPIGPPMFMAVVGAPSYLARRGIPKSPRDLARHNCINLRMPTRGGLYAWEFEKGAHKLNVRVEGQLVLNTSSLIVKAALAGMGLASLPSHIVENDIAKGRLKQVLADWCPPFPGYHLYYPGRRQRSPALSLLVEALRLPA
jgi:DNA-binding transcriptional LysR family regulator